LLGHAGIAVEQLVGVFRKQADAGFHQFASSPIEARGREWFALGGGQDAAGVDFFAEAVEGDAGWIFHVEPGAEDWFEALMVRQQGGMDVNRGEFRAVAEGRIKLLVEMGGDEQVRAEVFEERDAVGGVHIACAEDGQAVFSGADEDAAAAGEEGHPLGEGGDAPDVDGVEDPAVAEKMERAREEAEAFFEDASALDHADDLQFGIGEKASENDVAEHSATAQEGGADRPFQ